MDLDAHPTARLRVACYVTRERAGRLELLVFDHADFPEAYTQIPAGGVEPGETFRAAGLREVREETGLEQVEFVRWIGESDRPHPTTGDVRSTTYVHLRLTGRTAEHWRHVVRGRGEDADLRFDCRWEPLPIELADDQHELTWRLTEPTDTGAQDLLDAAIKDALRLDDRVVAALVYGSRVKGDDDAHSDVEYWIVASDDWSVAGLIQDIEPPLSLSRNEYAAHVAIWPGLVRGEFHVVAPDQLHLIAGWPQRGAPVARMLIKDDPAGRLAQTLAALPDQLPLPATAAEVSELCERFANWLVMAWHVQQRGERERGRLVLGLAREALLAMARLRYGATQHWLSQETRFELELPAHVVVRLRRIDGDDLAGLWGVGRQLWLELGDREGFALPSGLLDEIDEAVGRRALGWRPTPRSEEEQARDHPCLQADDPPREGT
jgi:lincosamide nucleotidyltransferase